MTGVYSFFNILLCNILLLSPVANLPPVSTIPVVNENLRKDVTTGVNDTGGKFAAGIVDSGGKFSTGVVDTGTLTCEYLRKLSKKF